LSSYWHPTIFYLEKNGTYTIPAQSLAAYYGPGSCCCSGFRLPLCGLLYCSSKSVYQAASWPVMLPFRASSNPGTGILLHARLPMLQSATLFKCRTLAMV